MHSMHPYDRQELIFAYRAVITVVQTAAAAAVAPATCATVTNYHYLHYGNGVFDILKLN
jgi:hypothetical protein